MKGGIDLSELKNELKEIKKKNNNEKNQIAEKPIFDIDNYTYINFTNDPEVDDFLNENSFKILNLAAGTNILLGTIFIEVQDYLSNLENADATYIKWLESNGFNRMTALRYKRRAEIYNSLISSKAKYFIGITSQRIIDEISKAENKEEIINYLEEMKEFNNIEDLLKKDIVLEIEDKTDKRNIEIKDRIKKLPLKNIEKLDSEKQKQIDNLVHQIEELLKEQK